MEVAIMDGGAEVRDPIADAEAQDDAPPTGAKREEVSGVELTSLFVKEAREQLPAVRGPIYLDELATDDVRPAVYYRRLTREDLIRLRKRAEEVRRTTIEDDPDIDQETLRDDFYLMMFIERALSRTGKRVFASSQLDEARAGNWNMEAIRRAVNEMADGSRTRLTDADLGNS